MGALRQGGAPRSAPMTDYTGSAQIKPMTCGACWVVGAFLRAASTAGATSLPAPLMLMGQPMHPHPGDAQDLRRARGSGHKLQQPSQLPHSQ